MCQLRKNRLPSTETLLVCCLWIVVMAGCGEQTQVTAGLGDPPEITVSSEAVTTAFVSAKHGKQVRLLDQGDSSSLVLIFLRTDCPVGNRYAPTIAKLHDTYSPKGFRFALIYPDPNESWDQIDSHCDEYDLDIEAFRDPLHALAKEVKATITPEAVVFDQERNMIYRGRIDNRAVDFGRERPRPTKHDLRDVLKSMSMGQTPEFSTQKAIGCFIE